MSYHVLLVNGDGRPGFHTSGLLHAIQADLQRRGAETIIWHLCERTLPPFHSENRTCDPTADPDPAVTAWLQSAQWAHAIVLGSPVCRDSFSGLLKNALDHLDFRQMWLKPVGLVKHGGRRRTSASLDHLRSAVRILHGISIPMQVTTQDDDFRRVGGRLVLENWDAGFRVGAFVDELLSCCEGLTKTT